MHQISLVELSQHIPKPIQNWTPSDVYTWLSLNSVEVDRQKLQNNNIDGKTIMKLTPNYWICQYETTKYMAKQIVEWLDQEAQEFNDLVNKAEDVDNQFKCQRSYSYSQAINNEVNFNEVIDNKPKSCQNLDYPMTNSILHKNFSGKLQEDLSKSNEIHQSSISSSSSSCLSSNSQNSVKSQGQIDQPQIQKQDQKQKQKQKKNDQLSSNQLINQLGFSEATERLEKKIRNVNNYINVNTNSNTNANTNANKLGNSKEQAEIFNTKNKQIPQNQITENQSISVGKWMKKKSDDTKVFNQRLKLKNKQIFRSNPKLYNYLNQNLIDNLPQTQNKNANIKKQSEHKNQKIDKKAVSPVHLIPKPVSNPSTAINSSASPVSIPSSPFNPIYVISSPLSAALDHPMVKFASSEFIAYTPQVHHINNYHPEKDNRLHEKSIKVTTQNYQKSVKGHAKIGRFKQNDVVLFDETVSRSHAQIVPSVKIDGKMEYCIKDVGSRFGTFVQTRSNLQQNIVGKSFLIGDIEIQILSAEPSKQQYSHNSNNNTPNINNSNIYSNPNNKKPTFDIKLLIDREKQQVFTNRVSLSIGKRIGNDIRIENNQMTAKIWMEGKQRKFYLEGSQGKLFCKIKQHELFSIEQHMDSNNKLEIVFGWLKTTFEVIDICVLCGKIVGGDCYCFSGEYQENQGEKCRQKMRERKIGEI